MKRLVFITLLATIALPAAAQPNRPTGGAGPMPIYSGGQPMIGMRQPSMQPGAPMPMPMPMPGQQAAVAPPPAPRPQPSPAVVSATPQPPALQRAWPRIVAARPSPEQGPPMPPVKTWAVPVLGGKDIAARRSRSLPPSFREVVY